MSTDSRRIEDWQGPVNWGSREIGVAPITNHSNRENRKEEEHLKPLPVDHPVCTDEVSGISHTQSPMIPDHIQEVRKQSDLPVDQCSERR